MRLGHCRFGDLTVEMPGGRLAIGVGEDYAMTMFGPVGEVMRGKIAADVVGAKRAGWRAAYLHGRPHDSPLPGSVRDTSVVADVELARLTDLEAAIETLGEAG